MRAVLDTSVLIGRHAVEAGMEAAISTVSIAELHFGLLVAGNDEARAERATRLGLVDARCRDAAVGPFDQQELRAEDVLVLELGLASDDTLRACTECPGCVPRTVSAR